MVVGPEFGPIGGVCVALVERQRKLAARSFLALAVGFAAAIPLSYLAALVFKQTGLAPDSFSFEKSTFAHSISNPDFFAFFVALCAGVAGMLSLTTSPIQRHLYRRRRADHLRDEPRRAGGLPIGRSRSSPPEHDPVSRSRVRPRCRPWCGPSRSRRR